MLTQPVTDLSILVELNSQEYSISNAAEIDAIALFHELVLEPTDCSHDNER